MSGSENNQRVEMDGVEQGIPPHHVTTPTNTVDESDDQIPLASKMSSSEKGMQVDGWTPLCVCVCGWHMYTLARDASRSR